MSLLSAYTHSAKNPVNPDEEQPEQSVSQMQESEARIQAKHNWKQSTITQEFVKQTQDEIGTLLTDAVNLSVSYPQHNNHQQIIHKLIKVKALQEVLDTHIYGK